MNKQQIINQLLKGALVTYNKFHIFPSVVIAQALLETGWLRYCSGNNLFGIKWTKGCNYESQELNTTEYVRGVKKTVKSKFRKYKSYEESFLDHGQLLYYSSRYKPIILSKNYEEACYNLYKCGYATDPKYAQKLIKIIEENKLYIYDPTTRNNSKVPSQKVENLKDIAMIKIIQSILNKLCIKDKNNNILTVDGIYGTLTKSAVMNFEKILGIKVDGIWNSSLLNIANSILDKPLCSINKPFSRKITRYIQFRVGAAIDGLWGPQTNTQVKKFQQNNNLKIDGWVGTNTWNCLLY